MVSAADGPYPHRAVANRAAKTTLLKILLGLCRSSAGQVLRLGRSLRDHTTLDRVGYMHENQVFPGYLMAHSLLWFYGALEGGLSTAVLATRVPALLDRFRLIDRAREPITRYSKGMVQRLSVAQAVLADPELLVLNEPMEGLDLEARTLLEELVASYRRAGKTVLLVTHTLADVERTCDRLAVLVGGRLVHLGPVASLAGSSGVDQAQRLEMSLRQIYQALGTVDGKVPGRPRICGLPGGSLCRVHVVRTRLANPRLGNHILMDDSVARASVRHIL